MLFFLFFDNPEVVFILGGARIVGASTNVLRFFVIFGINLGVVLVLSTSSLIFPITFRVLRLVKLNKIASLSCEKFVEVVWKNLRIEVRISFSEVAQWISRLGVSIYIIYGGKRSVPIELIALVTGAVRFRLSLPWIIFKLISEFYHALSPPRTHVCEEII
jgi:hypothetical protein